MKKLLILALAAFAFAACSDDNDTSVAPPVTPDYKVIGFDSAQLGTDNFLWGKQLATEQEELDYLGKPMKSNIYYGSLYEEVYEKNCSAQIYTYYSDYGHTSDVWNGFILSSQTDRVTEGYKNDKSVYAEGGADGTKQFAVGFYGSFTPDNKGVPVIKFSPAVTVQSLAVANTTYTYLYFTKTVTTPDKSDFKVVCTGYNGTTKTGEISVALVSGKTVKAGWERVDLTSLGKVSSLTFTVVCTDQMAPSYFCIDNLLCKK
ncbi:MAG: DUF4465 domain-containing protein [Alistipes sp.]